MGTKIHGWLLLGGIVALSLAGCAASTDDVGDDEEVVDDDTASSALTESATNDPAKCNGQLVRPGGHNLINQPSKTYVAHHTDDNHWLDIKFTYAHPQRHAVICVLCGSAPDKHALVKAGRVHWHEDKERFGKDTHEIHGENFIWNTTHNKRGQRFLYMQYLDGDPNDEQGTTSGPVLEGPRRRFRYEVCGDKAYFYPTIVEDEHIWLGLPPSSSTVDGKRSRPLYVRAQEKAWSLFGELF